jgi:hypothetical protein
MPVTSFTARRIELVRRQQDLTIDIVRAADAIAIDAETLPQATLSEHPLDAIERQARRIRLLQECLLEMQVILGWLPGEEIRASP